MNLLEDLKMHGFKAADTLLPGPVIEGSLVKNSSPLETATLRESKLISVKNIVPSKRNHRHDLGDLAELGHSMLLQGQTTPLQVFAIGAGQYEIIAGFRRYRAAIDEGIKDLRCDVFDASPEQAAEMRCVENAQRKDLRPMEEAENFDELRQLGFESGAIASRVGKSHSWVLSRLKLLSLGPEARALVNSSKLPSTVAVPLARLPSHKLQADAVKAMSKNANVVGQEAAHSREPWDHPALHVNARFAIAFLQNEFTKNLKGAPFELDDATLLPNAGPCTTCPKNSDCSPAELFSDFGKNLKGVCTDTACYAEKCEAQWSLTSEAAKEEGHEVLSRTDSKTIDSYGSPYVKLSEKVHGDPKGRTYGQIVSAIKDDEKKPHLVIAASPELKPVKLYDRREALKLLKQAKVLKPDAEPAGRSAGEADAEHKVRLKQAKEKSERLLRVTTELFTQAAGTFRKKAFTLVEARALAKLAFLRIDPAAEGEGLMLINAFNLKPREVLAWLEQAPQPELLAFTWACLAVDDFANTHGGYSAEVKRVAKVLGVDLKQREQATSLADKAEELFDAKKKKGGKA